MTGTDLATIAPSSTDLDRVARLGMWLAAAESKSSDPKAKGMAAALRIAYAEHLGLPAHAAQDIHVIDGGLQLSARLKRALAHHHGLRVELVEEGEDFCTAAVVQVSTGRELGRRTYTIDMARKQGLLDRKGQAWKLTPDRMLWARASARVLDDFAPWVTVGVQSLAGVTEMALEAEGYVDVIDDEIPFGEPEQDE